MSADVLVLAGHLGGQVTDATYELLGKARELASAWGGKAEVAVFGDAGLAAQLGAADTVVTVEHPSLAEYSPEAYGWALSAVLAARGPRLVLLPNDTMGLDLGTSTAGGGTPPRWRT